MAQPPHPKSKHMADRKAAGMTHAQVGKEFGVSKSTSQRKQAALMPPITTGQAAGSGGSTKGAQPPAMFSDGFLKMGSARK